VSSAKVGVEDSTSDGEREWLYTSPQAGAWGGARGGLGLSEGSARAICAFPCALRARRLALYTTPAVTMASIPSARILRPSLASPTSSSGRAFLAPSTQCARNAPAQAWFSTSPARARQDNNRIRGISAVRATGLRRRQTLSVKQKDFENQQLPKPVKIETQVSGTADHGLWGFFKERQLLQTPLSESRHGRDLVLTLALLDG